MGKGAFPLAGYPPISGASNWARSKLRNSASLETDRPRLPYPVGQLALQLVYWDGAHISAGHYGRNEDRRGFTLVELLIAVAIIMILAALAIPSFEQARESARIAKAVADIRTLETDIMTYEVTNGSLPNTLADIGRADLMDPWGNPYQYLNFANVTGKGAMRKDRFLVPINSTYDLYSMGKDGQTVPPITAKVSWDDVIRASDGAYIGLAAQY